MQDEKNEAGHLEKWAQEQEDVSDRKIEESTTTTDAQPAQISRSKRDQDKADSALYTGNGCNRINKTKRDLTLLHAASSD